MTPAGEAGRGPRVAIAGWIGSTNLGDELIARAVYGRLTELGAEPLAITIDPQRTGALLGAAGVEHHRIRDTPGLIRALGIALPADGDQIRLSGRHLYFNCQKSWEELGKPQITIQQSLRDTYDWYRAHGMI